MADVPISGLTALGAAPATNDLLVLVDVSDTTQAPTGTTKNMTTANLFTAPTFTGQVTVTGGTVTASTPLTVTQTWNNAAVAFTAVKLNVTSTASDAASLLVDLQVASSSVWKVTKAGAVTQASSLTISAGGLTVTAGGITVTAGTAALQAVTATGSVSITTNATYFTGKKSGGAAGKLIGLDATDIVSVAGATGTLDGAESNFRIPYLAAASCAAGSATNNGIVVAEGTNNRLVYYSGGNRYYLAGTLF